MTTCIIYKHPKILLGMKKRGFGEGKWNGFGGKVLPNEIIEVAAKRELLEEAGIEVEHLSKVGVLDFEFKGRKEILQVHFFKAENFSGEPIETEEMKPQWFNVNEIPIDKMWPDDQYWMPVFLKDKKFIGRFLYDEKENILEKELSETEDLPIINF